MRTAYEWMGRHDGCYPLFYISSYRIHAWGLFCNRPRALSFCSQGGGGGNTAAALDRALILRSGMAWPCVVMSTMGMRGLRRRHGPHTFDPTYGRVRPRWKPLNRPVPTRLLARGG